MRLKIIFKHQLRKWLVFFAIATFFGTGISLIQAWGGILVQVYQDGNLYGQFGPAKHTDRGLGPVSVDGHRWWYFASQYKYGVEVVTSSNAGHTAATMRWENYFAEPPSETPPSWSVSSNSPSQHDLQDGGMKSYYELISGWPFQAWYCRVEESGSRKISWGYLPVSSPGPHPVIYPLRPTPSLALSSMFYGSFVLAIGVCTRKGFRGSTRRRRIRRGSCLECGYSVVDLTACPECGEPVPERVPKRNTIGS
jgi:hypothetical protein